ncbi:MAG: PepSY-associated TM helix domain-containing protein [Colwellia sp.]|nr:PepSY-associated TM helix domain-containing protein [Colwellia sp.]
MKKRSTKFRQNSADLLKRPARKAGVKYWQWTKSSLAKKMFSLSRWLHIYVSTVLFSLLVFFCFTGITLNHAAWFSADGEEQLKIEPLPQSLLTSLNNDDELALFNLQKYVEKLIGLEQVRSIDVDKVVAEISFDYPIPAGYVFVTVYLDTSEIEIEQKSGSLISLLNDLHKGRHSGEFWSWLIDISAGLMLLFSITGLVILLQNNKRRAKGVMYILLGSIAPWLAYLLWVPRIS